jgi:hypothetical protein
MKKSTDGELLMVLNEHLGSLLSCRNTNCDCLGILTNQNIWERVAKYLVQFERKNKYNQDSIFWSGTSMLSPLGLGRNTCGIAYHTIQPGPTASIVFVHPKHINYAHLGCIHCWV